MADMHLDDELRVAQTTPQGSQDNAVDHGHEERDTNVGGIMKWLIGTGALAVVTLGIVVGIFKTLDRVTDSPVKPSPLFVEQKLPPAPYLEGFTYTVKQKGKPDQTFRAGMTEHQNDVRLREAAELSRWKMGASDPYTWSVPIDKNEVKDIPDQPAGDPTATDKMFHEGQLSDASGGMRDNPGR